MGSSVWEFMWCLDKITQIDKNGVGWVLGGKPVNLKDMQDELGGELARISERLSRLEQSKYIIKKRTPYGIIIGVNKAQKRFAKNSNSSIAKNSNSYSIKSNSHSIKSNSNKTVTVDNKSVDNKSIERILKIFENEYKTKLPYRKKEEEAISTLLENMSLEELRRWTKYAIKIQGRPYAPSITRPTDLQNKLPNLKNYAKRNKTKHTAF